MKTDRQNDAQKNMAVRIDKWLWAARFFKTRALAADAINGGKVHLNGSKTKPAKHIKEGDRLSIRRGPYEHAIVVCALNHQRRPAKEAVLLYEESAASIENRQRLAEQLRQQAPTGALAKGRPSKKNRRQIIQFTGK
ncbi:MAG: RNA-binding protein [Gammaproteobacteria bacterium]|nr:RNA-binding protein [Gammaproteobacteria bacterium]